MPVSRQAQAKLHTAQQAWANADVIENHKGFKLQVPRTLTMYYVSGNSSLLSGWPAVLLVGWFSGRLTVWMTVWMSGWLACLLFPRGDSLEPPSERDVVAGALVILELIEALLMNSKCQFRPRLDT